jgi:DNA-binding MarR family transcriptional regulator
VRKRDGQTVAVLCASRRAIRAYKSMYAIETAYILSFSAPPRLVRVKSQIFYVLIRGSYCISEFRWEIEAPHAINLRAGSDSRTTVLDFPKLVRMTPYTKSSRSTSKQASDDTNDANRSYNFKEQVGHLLRRNYQRHLAIFQAVAPDKQLTSVQFVALCAISDYGPSSQVELVNSTAIDQATIRGIISRLAERKLIKLSADPSDKRKVVASLTNQGRQLLSTMVPSAQRISVETLAPLNPAEREALIFLLRKLMESENAD